MIWRIDVFSYTRSSDNGVRSHIKDLGIKKECDVASHKVYYIESDAASSDITDVARRLLIDPVLEEFTVSQGFFPREPAPGDILITYNPGVCDPVALSFQKALGDISFGAEGVCTARAYTFSGLREDEIRLIAEKLLYNPLIEHIVAYEKVKDLSTLEAFSGKKYEFSLQTIPLENASDEKLQEISRRGCLSLSLDEMKIIQDYFCRLKRSPTDCELETIAQTWSEHCAHKTFRGRIDYTGKDQEGNVIEEKTINNLLKETVMKATKEIASQDCISVFEDNSGVVRFNDDFHLCFKVETHNHPSSLEPYGGASTGIGGVIRDILGTGCAARPVASIDVFCFSPWQMAYDEVPKGLLHPRRVIKGVVRGVRDYGNRMGIPTVAGAVMFDKRFLGNPLVYCGTLGILPHDKAFKEAHPGDVVIVCGAKTGRDGIHGATFSSTELDETTITLTQAVQIGNPIEEKKLTEAILRAQKDNLFTAITDCGAGGLSSAVTELAQGHGVRVDLEKVPSKYAGLTYTEIWISESQERMVFFTQKNKLAHIKKIFEEEEVEYTVIGEVTSDKKLSLFYEGQPVCCLDLDFLFEIPRLKKKAEWIAPVEKDIKISERSDYTGDLKTLLSSPNIAPKDWIITEYDHEVQGGSVLKPFMQDQTVAVGDASCVRPDLNSEKGVLIGLGINPFYSDIDPYWMAALAIDEALRNIIASGGNLSTTFLLDNFSWGAPTDEKVLAGLVRASEACYDFATQFKTPFISGKDSLYNEYIVEGKRISIPGTLLISAVSVIDDWRKTIPSHFTAGSNLIYLVGKTTSHMGASEYFRAQGVTGGVVPKVETSAYSVFMKVSEAISSGPVCACHDCSEGGMAVAVAEMCMGSGHGADVFLKEMPKGGEILDYELLFSESPSRFIIEVRKEEKQRFENMMGDTPYGLIGCVSEGEQVTIYGTGGDPVVTCGVRDLRKSWLEAFAEFRI